MMKQLKKSWLKVKVDKKVKTNAEKTLLSQLFVWGLVYKVIEWQGCPFAKWDFHKTIKFWPA